MAQYGSRGKKTEAAYAFSGKRNRTYIEKTHITVYNATMNNITIGKHTIGKGNSTYIISEVGSNFDGDLERAKHLAKISKEIGETLTKLHNQDIIHGDLTTSNMILSNKNNKLYLIDFGLGFHSYKIEDKAVDLHLLKQALEAKHYKIAEECITIILKNYKPDKYKLILERIPVIESRGRYKTKK